MKPDARKPEICYSSIFAGYAVFVAAFAIAVYHLILPSAEQEQGDKAMLLAVDIATRLELDDSEFDRLLTLSFDELLKDPANIAFEKKARELMRRSEIKYIYLMSPLSGERVKYKVGTSEIGKYGVLEGTPLNVVYVLDAVTDEQTREKDTEGKGYTDQDRYTVMSGMYRRVYDEKKPAHIINQDEWGSYITGFAPLYSPSGSYLGLIGVDLFLDKYMLRMRQYRYLIGGFAVTLIIFGLCVLFFAVRAKTAESALAEAYTELRSTQDQLVQSAKLASIGELSSGIAHELNQPLMVIRMTAQYMLRFLGTGNPGRDQLIANSETIERNTKRMMNIINHLRTFARKSGTVFDDADINKIIEDSLMMISEQLRLHNIEVIRNLADRLPKVRGDANQLEQVILNLLANARDAIEAKGDKEGRIEIISRVSDASAVEIIIRDNGTGIDEKHLKNIFDPFFTTKEVGKGTGLGLSISYGIIREHGGTIRVAKSGPEGTTFRITLPTYKEQHDGHRYENTGG